MFPQTLRGDEGEGLEKALITLWIGIYGFSAGIGTVLLLAANEQKRLLPKIVLGGYLLLLGCRHCQRRLGREVVLISGALII